MSYKKCLYLILASQTGCEVHPGVWNFFSWWSILFNGVRRERESTNTNYLFIICALLMQISSRYAFRGSVPGVRHITEDDGGGGLGMCTLPLYHY